MKNWITFGSMIGIALVLVLNVANADQHRQGGGHQHFQRNQNRGRRPPWGRPGYYHPQRQYRRRAWAAQNHGEPYYNQYGNQYGNPYGYYPQPPIVYAPPPPPLGLNLFFGIGNGAQR